MNNYTLVACLLSKPVADHLFPPFLQKENRSGNLQSLYSLYKHFITTYTASDFQNPGVVQQGKEYNEYKDDNKYYVVDESNNMVAPLSLKPKEIKAFFASPKQQVDSYFKQRRNDEIDEKFLAGLVNSLNQ